MTLALVGFVAQADNHGKPATTPAPADAATTAAPAPTEGAATEQTGADAHKDMKKKPAKKGKKGHEEKK